MTDERWEYAKLRGRYKTALVNALAAKGKERYQPGKLESDFRDLGLRDETMEEVRAEVKTQGFWAR